MVSIEKITRKKNTYYYLSKNFRVGLNKWKKIRRYVGNNEPSTELIKRTAEEIEKEAKKSNLIRAKEHYKYLADEKAEVLEEIKDQYKSLIKKLSIEGRTKYEQDFLVRFTYNTNAIEGNRLSLRDTFLILQENIIPKDASSYEYNEVLNSRKCIQFIKKYGGELNKSFLLKIHKILTTNTSVETIGKFRDHNVLITGSPHVPPSYIKVPDLINELFVWYNNNKKRVHPLELACLFHTKFTRIHPFSDGNGRTARIISNFILYKNGYPMFIVDFDNRREYYEALDESDKGNEKVFVDFIFKGIVNKIKSHI